MTSRRNSFRAIPFLLAISLIAIVTPRAAWLRAQDAAPAGAATLTVQPTSDPVGWEVRLGDELLAGYRSDFKGTPIVFPLIAPGGHHATRGFPIVAAKPTEKSDHDHHRSLWMTHGEVNDVDFWIDDEGCGKIVQTAGSASTDAESGAAVIVTKNDWNGPDGKRILSDDRRVAFSVDGEKHIVDFDVVLHATDGPVHFGDTKEGSFGIRVPGTMKVDAKLGGKITNAEGEHDADAWGKHSPWVDYSGPVDDTKLSITIFNHPSSFHYPCRWHVRTYGLFAANPFGESHFTGGKKTEGYTLPAGESLRLSYRITLREGDFDPAKAAADFDTYSHTQRPKLSSTRAAHRVLLQGNGRLAVIEADGSVSWEMPWGGTHDIHALANGHYLLLDGVAGVAEVNPATKEVVWRYDAKGQAKDAPRIEVHACQRLDNGNTMLAVSGAAKIIEIDRSGTVVQETPLTVEHPNAHSDTRLVRKIENGHYLVAHEADGKVREYEPGTGKVVWEYSVPMFGKTAKDGHGPEAFGNRLFSAVRLANGNTLIGAGNGHSVLEVTPQKEIVWELHQDDLPGIRLAWVTTVEVLSNGNYVIGNCHAGPGQPILVEIDPKSKQVVWQLDRHDDFGNNVSNSVVLDAAARTH